MSETQKTTPAKERDNPNLKYVPLATPLPYGDGQKLSGLTLRRPHAGELRGINLRQMNDIDPDIIMTLASRLSMTPVTIGQLAPLDSYDLIQVWEALTFFFNNPPTAVPG